MKAFVWNFEGSPLAIQGTIWEPWKSHTRAIIQPIKFHFISRMAMASTISSFQKEEVGVQTPLLASPPLQVLLRKDLV
jgi:hypothetical protein